jgi:hypothetical protein
MAKKWNKNEKKALELLSGFNLEEVVSKLKDMGPPKGRPCIICREPVAKKGGKYCVACQELGGTMYKWKYTMDLVRVLRKKYDGRDAIQVLLEYDPTKK